MIVRKQLEVLSKRVENETRKFIQVILGPRQVGKSTMVRQFLEKTQIPYTSVSADIGSALNEIWIEQQWEVARFKMQQSESKEYVLVIDEIQNLNQWSEYVKKLWDEDTRNNVNLKVVLLGSSRLLLQQGLNESLSGRFETIYMNHWTFDEVQEGFGHSEEEYAWFGGYPGSLSLIKDERRWRSYVQSSIIDAAIKKDILMLTRINKPALLENLFYLGCQYSSQILSFNKIIGQLQDAGNTTTLSHYLSLLDSAGLISGLEKYAGGEVGRRGSSPKFQVQNSAFIGATSDISFKEALEKPDRWGRIVESVIGAHLINQSNVEAYQIYYWRHGNNEVDYVMKYQNKVIALEVKSGGMGRKQGMNAFSKMFSPHKVYIISNDALSWKEFIKINPIDLV